MEPNIINARTVAIQTKYYGPTNTKGSRVKADAGMGRTAWVGYHSGETDDPHRRAALALIAKMGWSPALLIEAHGETGNTYTMVNPHDLENLRVETVEAGRVLAD